MFRLGAITPSPPLAQPLDKNDKQEKERLTATRVLEKKRKRMMGMKRIG